MKKGFTLVELLAVFIIIGIIALVAVPSLLDILKNSTKQTYELFKRDIEIATEHYIENNISDYQLNSPGDNVFISIEELVNNGFYNKKNINPDTKEPVKLTNMVLVYVKNDYTKSYNFTGTDASIDNYVKYGLRSQYDGYTKLKNINNKIIWSDLINNNNGELINGNGLEDWNDFKIILENENNYILATESSSIIGMNDELTIEIVYQISGDNEILFRNQGLGFNKLNLNNTGVIEGITKNSSGTSDIFPTGTASSLVTQSKIHTISVQIKKDGSNYVFQYYGDGVKLNMTDNIGQKYSNLDFKIGKDNTNNGSNVYIYGFRLYNRILQDDEILKNYKIDLNRFDWRKL